jgi:hypothetical protein
MIFSFCGSWHLNHMLTVSGLERTTPLAKDLEYFQSEGYTIPEPSEAGLTYSKLLEELSESNPPAFICHFYNVYFAHSG